MNSGTTDVFVYFWTVQMFQEQRINLNKKATSLDRSIAFFVKQVLNVDKKWLKLHLVQTMILNTIYMYESVTRKNMYITKSAQMDQLTKQLCVISNKKLYHLNLQL